MNENTFIADRVDGGIVVSETDIDLEDVASLLENSELRELSAVHRQLANWAEDVQGNPRSSTSIFERDKYVTPSRVYAQMGAAYDALDDDIVSNVADTSESLAFNKVRVLADNEDEEDVWNQIFADLDLDTWVRKAWREMFTVSQFYGVRWWGMRNYQVRGTRKERKARKEFPLQVPVRLGFLDPTRVVPVQVDPFGNKSLAWIASDADQSLFANSQLEFEKKSTQYDALVAQLFVGEYKPTKKEKEQLAQENINAENLLLLNPDMVWHHTLTMATYERWPRLRMKSVLPILDLKQQLRALDRAVLLGGTNFIVLVKKGTDAHPVKRNAEIEMLRTQMRTQSKTPVIISDHRLEIEIITPDLSSLLQGDKWDNLDKRLLMRLWGTFLLNPSEGRDDSLTLGRVIARGIQSRRHMLRRSIEQHVLRATIDRNGDLLQARAKVEFTPRRIELEMDEAIAAIIQELRDRGDISRESVLNELGFSQALEADRRKREKKMYDDIFTPVNVPFDSPGKTTPGGSARSNPKRTQNQGGSK